MARVSVCIPSFNHEAFVRVSIESVLAQSFEDHEILITDDGSSDRTVDEIRSIGDRRISLHTLPTNRGACIALNCSIRRSTGEYIAVLNSDDVFLPGKLAQQVRYLDSHREIGAVFGYPAFIDEAGKPVSDEDTFYGSIFKVEDRSRLQWLRHFFMRGNALCHPTVLIRRRCYDEVGYYNPALAQLPDLDMWVRLVKRFDIQILKEPLTGFRILSANRNASAPRPEVAIRLAWEWRKILEHYMTLDERSIVEAFPELGPRVERETRASWISRLAYRMLQKYLQRDAVGTIGDDEARSGRPVLWCLAELALAVGRAPHVSFALDAMYSVLMREGAAVRYEDLYRELIQHAGSYDLFGMLSAPQHRRVA